MDRKYVDQYVLEHTARGLYNLKLGESLNLPYCANSLRLPVLRSFADRFRNSLQGDDNLRKLVEEVFQARISESMPCFLDLRLPMFVTALLQKVDRREQIWPTLAELRVKGGGLRARRREIEAALANGNLREAREVREAMDADADALSMKLAIPVGIGAALAFLPKLGTVSTELIATIGILGAAAKLDLKSLEAVRRRVFKPHLWFLTHTFSDARTFVNVWNKAKTLWAIDDDIPVVRHSLEMIRRWSAQSGSG